ncbi:hypothetical protein [Armatimonas sp.]|uniref:hypothetical protein n=1 Tax=Armatimonas sp. TaxID=1872638 RepID=UPI00286D68E6|nr:hypothetical protein [Armatimonas sp.]
MRLPKTVLLCLSLPCLAAGLTRASQPNPGQYQPETYWTPALESQNTEEQNLVKAINRYQAQAYYYINVQHKYKEAEECLHMAERLQNRTGKMPPCESKSSGSLPRPQILKAMP